MSFFNSVGVTSFPSQQTSANLSDGQNVNLTLIGAQTVRFDITGTWSGTLFFEASSDGIVYQTVQLLPFGPLLASQLLSQSVVSSTTQNGSWFGGIAGMDSFRVRASLTSGTPTVFLQISQAVSTLDVFEHADGFVDTHLSTTTPLGSNGVFTGQSTDMLPFTAVRLSLFTDQPSAVNTGLSVQWSNDGTNWDFQQNTGIPASPAGNGVHMVFGRIARYMRIVYTNGVTAQGVFRLGVIHQRVTPPQASSFINQPLTDGDTAMTVKAVIAGKNVSGVYVPVSVDGNNSLIVSDNGLAATSNPTPVTNGTTVPAMVDKMGRQVVIQGHARDLVGIASLSSSSSSAVSFISAGAAGVFNDITSLVITNTTATATIVTLSDNGAGGNTHVYALAGNGGIVINFNPPMPQGTAAAAWDVLNSAAVLCKYEAVYVKNL